MDIKTLTPEKIKELLSDDQNRMYVFLAVIVLVVALYLGFAVIPKFSDMSQTIRNLGEFTDKIEVVENRYERFDEMEEKLSGLRTELAGYSKGLPEEKDIPEFLERLSEIAKTSGVKILSITPSDLIIPETNKEKGASYYGELPIVVTAKSGFHQLGRFIDNLEHGKRFILIKSLDIQYDAKFPRKHNVKMSLGTYVSIDNVK